MTKVNWSELDQKYWVQDGDDVLWFESPLDAKDAARRVELEAAVKAERNRIAAWLHRIGKRQLADAVEKGEDHE